MPSDRDLINQLIATDPEIQRIIQGVWGNTTVDQRPSDTPKNLEKRNSNASKAIKAVLDRRGIHLPSKTFVNPRTNSIEGMHGWAGLPTAAKIGIIGGAAAGGLGLAGALGAFGGAAGAGGSAAGAAGGAAVPSVGATGGLTAGAFPSIAGTSGLAGTAGAGTLASTPLLSSAAMPTATSAGNMGATMAGGGGIGSKIVGGLKNFGGRMLENVMNDPEKLARGLAGVAQSQASNRGTALDAMLEADRNRLAAAADRRTEESDLWQKLQAADYMKSGGTPKPSTFTTASGKTLKMMDFGPRPISEGNKQMASTLESQLMQRLNTPMQLHDYDSKMNPGIMEQINNYASPALALWNASKVSPTAPRRPQNPLAAPTPTPQAPPVPGLPTNNRGYVNDDDYTG